KKKILSIIVFLHILHVSTGAQAQEKESSLARQGQNQEVDEIRRNLQAFADGDVEVILRL
ncbi:MAG: hypothetical protein V3T39_01400, partial [Gammaproteobacteria bacterium]